MTPTVNDSISLDQLNQLLAEQKGVSVDELAITNGVNPNPKTHKENEPKSELAVEDAKKTDSIEELTPAQMRSKADSLFKQAQSLRKQADHLDPPKKKQKAVAS
jgi:hypothetical protein